MGSCIGRHSSVKPFQEYKDAPIKIDLHKNDHFNYSNSENSVILHKEPSERK